MWGVWVGIFNLISGDVIGYVVAGGYSVSCLPTKRNLVASV